MEVAQTRQCVCHCADKRDPPLSGFRPGQIWSLWDTKGCPSWYAVIDSVTKVHVRFRWLDEREKVGRHRFLFTARCSKDIVEEKPSAFAHLMQGRQLCDGAVWLHPAAWEVWAFRLEGRKERIRFALIIPPSSESEDRADVKADVNIRKKGANSFSELRLTWLSEAGSQMPYVYFCERVVRKDRIRLLKDVLEESCYSKRADMTLSHLVPVQAFGKPVRFQEGSSQAAGKIEQRAPICWFLLCPDAHDEYSSLPVKPVVFEDKDTGLLRTCYQFNNLQPFGVEVVHGIFTEEELYDMECRVDELRVRALNNEFKQNTVDITTKRIKIFLNFVYGYGSGHRPIFHENCERLDDVAPWLREVAERLGRAKSGVQRINSVVINMYGKGGGLQSHKDPVFFVRPIVSLRLCRGSALSFGCTGQVASDPRVAVAQARGDVLTMRDYATDHITHAVRGRSVDGYTVSIMFRYLDSSYYEAHIDPSLRIGHKNYTPTEKDKQSKELFYPRVLPRFRSRGENHADGQSDSDASGPLETGSVLDFTTDFETDDSTPRRSRHYRRHSYNDDTDAFDSDTTYQPNAYHLSRARAGAKRRRSNRSVRRRRSSYTEIESSDESEAPARNEDEIIICGSSDESEPNSPFEQPEKSTGHRTARAETVDEGDSTSTICQQS